MEHPYPRKLELNVVYKFKTRGIFFPKPWPVDWEGGDSEIYRFHSSHQTNGKQNKSVKSVHNTVVEPNRGRDAEDVFTPSVACVT